VVEISRRAGVNRATFYHHFEDKADFLERGIEGLLEDITARINAGTASAEARILDRVTLFFERVGERRLTPIGEENLIMPITLASRAPTYLLFGLVSRWLEHPKAYSARSLATCFL
jgi:AcrR family transcriptional regulator